MKNKIILFAVICLLVLITFMVISSEEVNTLKLIKGKNFIQFNITQPFYVKTFIELNPQIEVISFKKDNKTFGYVNVFSGIGDNFIVQKNIEYEIIAKENVSIIFPNS
jgi:hypothetical protein